MLTAMLVLMWNPAGIHADDQVSDSYIIEATLTSRKAKRVAHRVKSPIAVGNSEQLRNIVHRPFVVGLQQKADGVEPVIHFVEDGMLAEIKILTAQNNTVSIDATIELIRVVDVKTKPFPGLKDKTVQCVRVAGDKARFVETVSMGEKLTGTLEVDGVKYDIVLTVKNSTER